ncbi:hypothetical protein CNMCM5878_004636 [Aspergillus fumigatiaffinis]|nr:hypothetical protein CNMCM5878_004636 [Aspergillus fumigatiaffinis]
MWPTSDFANEVTKLKGSSLHPSPSQARRYRADSNEARLTFGCPSSQPLTTIELDQEASHPNLYCSLRVYAQMAQRRFRMENYTVGWVCALPVELAAARKMLDEKHPDPPQDASDSNLYTLGRIGEHDVVIACLPAGRTGTNSAAGVAVQMKAKFKSIRFGLMVGIGGGVPSAGADIRLGDVVVSQPHGRHGGVVQYDFGKTRPDGFERTGYLNAPPTVLLNALAILQANYLIGESNLSKSLFTLSSLPAFARDNAGPDDLFESSYTHTGGDTCEKCSKERLVIRTSRTEDIRVHFGTIASGNQLMRDAAIRDKLSLELDGALCFEMEAAGLLDSFPCLVIRGISDYADSHKNKRWQGYAAAVAAACAKEILSIIPASEIKTAATVDETIGCARLSEKRRSAIDNVVLDRFPTNRPRNLTHIYGDLVVTFTSAYDWVWNDRGSGAIRDGAFWHPKPQGSLRPLGSIGINNYSNVNGQQAALLVGANPNNPPSGGMPAVANPIGYTLIWTDKGSHTMRDCSFWRPVAPSGYVSLGDVAQLGWNKSLWNDRRSGADKDVSIWEIHPYISGANGSESMPIPAGTFRSNQSHSKPDPGLALVPLL